MNRIELVERVGVLLCIAGNAWVDWKTREISGKLTMLLALYGMAAWYLRREGSWQSLVLNGGILLGICAASGGKIGMGDGIFLWVLRLCMPLDRWITVVWMALCACSAAVLFKNRSGEKEPVREVPFLPFVLLGYAGEWWLE